MQTTPVMDSYHFDVTVIIIIIICHWIFITVVCEFFAADSEARKLSLLSVLCHSLCHQYLTLGCWLGENNTVAVNFGECHSVIFNNLPNKRFSWRSLGTTCPPCWLCLHVYLVHYTLRWWHLNTHLRHVVNCMHEFAFVASDIYLKCE